MAAYLFLEIAITDQERWRAYREAVMSLIGRNGGKRVTGGDVIQLEGASDGRISLFEFADVEAITTFWNSPEYAEVKKLRAGAASLRAWAVPIQGQQAEVK